MPCQHLHPLHLQLHLQLLQKPWLLVSKKMCGLWRLGKMGPGFNSKFLFLVDVGKSLVLEYLIAAPFDKKPLAQHAKMFEKA